LPVGGEILEFNEKLADQPDLVNTDPYGDGWMIKMKIADAAELDNLLDAAAYAALIG
jgi:glycine cleavage system H protein